jgi:hypothetical protein
MLLMKAFEESLQAAISKLNNDVENQARTIKQKEGSIADLIA